MTVVKGMGQGLAAATTALGAAAVIEAAARGQDRPPTAIAAVVALVVVAPLALVRLWPATAAVLSASAAVSGLLISCPVTVAGVIALAVLYEVAGRERPLRISAALALPFAVYAAVPASSDSPGGKAVALLLLAISALATAVGAALRLRDERRRYRATEQSAAASLMEYAARGERARIARELHDVVAHHLTTIALQAEAARLATAGLPPEGARRLTAIGDTARIALTEMRRLLGVLREDVGVDAEPTRRPQPALRQLNTLLDEVRDTATGAGVRLIVSGAVEPLDAGIELTAYRIVQEALTNTRRHAPGAAVDVELRYGGDELIIRVFDNGPGPASDGGSGHGLAGMRERAAMVGGQVTAGGAPNTGFLVEAVLPTKGAAP
jgi:signal transduction histidine kinase